VGDGICHHGKSGWLEVPATDDAKAVREGTVLANRLPGTGFCFWLIADR